MGQIFCSRGRPLENSRGRPVDFTGRPVNSTGRPLEFSRGRPLEQKIWPNISRAAIRNGLHLQRGGQCYGICNAACKQEVRSSSRMRDG